MSRALDIADAALKFDRTTTGEGGRPLAKYQKVINVDPAVLNRALRETNPAFYELMPGRTERAIQHAASGGKFSLPEVGAAHGQVGFSNGRHRTRLAESVGMKSIPVAVEKGNEAALRALLKKFTGKDGAMSALDAAARALARDDVARGQRLMNTAT